MAEAEDDYDEDCPGCLCCTHAQCAGRSCPTNYDGESLCPCTEPYD